jgi:Xaa-Pro aminopeptidase
MKTPGTGGRPAAETSASEARVHGTHAHGTRVIVAASSRDMNLFYLTGFRAGDPFILIQAGGKTVLVMSDLERGRARREARCDEILSASLYRDRCIASGIEEPSMGDILLAALNDLGLSEVSVPHDFPLGIADVLRRGNVAVEPHSADSPFVPERVVKSEEEIGLMRTAMKANEEALSRGIDAIAEAGIRDDMLHAGGEPLTAERVRAVIDGELFARGYLSSSTIVAAGDQGCNPHSKGFGPLPANTPIIIDVFPRSMQNRYCADMTRTVVRGKASPRVREMYDAVRGAQNLVFSSLKAGVDGSAVHGQVEKHFADRGFKTGPTKDGRMEGFFHGTGHGLGLDVHELPRFGKKRSVFEAGMVVTVEPGLYYFGTGGVRLEDVVVIRDDGCENICSLEKRLEI